MITNDNILRKINRSLVNQENSSKYLLYGSPRVQINSPPFQISGNYCPHFIIKPSADDKVKSVGNKKFRQNILITRRNGRARLSKKYSHDIGNEKASL